MFNAVKKFLTRSDVPVSVAIVVPVVSIILTGVVTWEVQQRGEEERRFNENLLKQAAEFQDQFGQYLSALSLLTGDILYENRIDQRKKNAVIKYLVAQQVELGDLEPFIPDSHKMVLENFKIDIEKLVKNVRAVKTQRDLKKVFEGTQSALEKRDIIMKIVRNRAGLQNG